MRWLALAALLGCPSRPPPDAAPPDLVLTSDEAAPPDEGTPVGPGPWSEPGGLALVVPDGWSGHAGPPGGALLLRLVHDDSDVGVEVWAFARSGDVAPRPRPGCAPFFESRGRYGDVPLLGDTAVTATCLPEDPTAPVVQGWYGLVGDREIHVELVLPAGRVVWGRAVAEPVLSGLSRW